MTFTLQLLGGVALYFAGAPVTARAVQRRRLALLAVLALAGERGVRRERAAALLWPTLGEVQARRRLSDAVYDLRRTLGDDAVRAAGDALRLDPTVVRVDVHALERALDGGALERAAALYTGPLLDGLRLDDAPEFERWADAERARFARRVADALGSLASVRERAGDPAGAVVWLRRLLDVDPLDAPALVRLVAAHEAAGDRAAALNAARAGAARLRAELGVAPPALDAWTR